MPRYKLRTLLILLAVLPPVLAGAWFLVAPGNDPVFAFILLASIFAVASYVIYAHFNPQPRASQSRQPPLNRP